MVDHCCVQADSDVPLSGYRDLLIESNFTRPVKQLDDYARQLMINDDEKTTTILLSTVVRKNHSDVEEQTASGKLPCVDEP